MNFDKDIELPAILDVELLKDKTEKDKNENIKVNKLQIFIKIFEFISGFLNIFLKLNKTSQNWRKNCNQSLNKNLLKI